MSEVEMGHRTTATLSGSTAKSLTSRAYQELRADILSGRLLPGKKLRIKDLQDRFDSSFSVVREALSRLCSEDLVHAVDQRGFVTSSISLADLKDLMRTRRQIEGLAIRQAIEQAPPQWEASVSAAFAKLAVLEADGEDVSELSPEWIAAHERFHEAINEGCGSPLLIRLCRQLAERTERYRHLSVTFAPSRDGPAEHKEILRAILARDVDKAAAVLDQHFATTQEILINAWGAAGAE